jgi:hypothetical protein
MTESVNQSISVSSTFQLINPFFNEITSFLIFYQNTFFTAHISILSKAPSAWPMFWPVLRRCRILGWDWSGAASRRLGASFHFPFWELWCMLVSVCFHNLVTYAQWLRDLYSACLMFRMRTHTGPRFIVSSERRESHQPQVIIGRLIRTRKSLSLTELEPRTSRIGVGRSNHCATGSLQRVARAWPINQSMTVMIPEWTPRWDDFCTMVDSHSSLSTENEEMVKARLKHALENGRLFSFLVVVAWCLVFRLISQAPVAKLYRSMGRALQSRGAIPAVLFLAKEVVMRPRSKL